MVSGWKVQYKDGGYQWTLIGKMNPQLPQMFYPVLEDITLTKGDIVVRAASGTSYSSQRYENYEFINLTILITIIVYQVTKSQNFLILIY